MGRCSELPNDNHHGQEYSDQISMTDKHKRKNFTASSYQQHRQQRDDGNEPLAEAVDHFSADSQTPLMEKQGNNTNNFFLNVARQSQNRHNNEGDFKEIKMMTSRQRNAATPVRNETRTAEPIAQPPDSAKRMRCYRLNLDSSIEPTTGRLSGPMQSKHIPIQLSVSEDSCATGKNNVAASTAQIFRGLTVARDGTVQSKKSGRSSRSVSNGKADEKSRQAAKIDKAKDLVEESANGVVGDKKEDSKMMSLFIMGEYDDMKNLVRDGSKRLKDAEGLPDEALLSLNAKRFNSSEKMHSPISSSRSDTRKRSPHPGGYSPVKMKLKSPQGRKSFSGTPSNGSSPMPRLKENPKDTRSRLYSSSKNNSRRYSSEKCSNIPIFGGGDSDWSDTLSMNFNSIWSCGASRGGKPDTSPIAAVSQHKSNQGARITYYSDRIAERRDEAPGNRFS